MNVHKRLLIILVITILLITSITGCKGNEKKEEDAHTEITLWYYWDSDHDKQELQKIISVFNESQSEVYVKAQYIPDQDLKKKLALSMVDGTMPEIALVDSADFQYFNSIQSFVDLTDEIPELQGYIKEAKESCTIDGRIYGFPFGLNCPGLFYNNDLLKDAGVSVPGTWEEFYNTAVKMTKEGQYGCAITALQSEESLYTFLPILWSMGGDISSINSDRSKKAFELLKKLCEGGAMSRQSISLTPGDTVNQFANGNIAMMFNSAAAVERIRDINPDMNFGVTYMPTNENRVSVIGGEVFGVTQGKHQKEAINFLKFLADKGSEYPSRFGMMAAKENEMDKQFLDDPQKRIFVDIFKTARLREFSKKWPNISMVISDAMEKVIIGGEDNDKILDDAAAKIEVIREDKQ